MSAVDLHTYKDIVDYSTVAEACTKRMGVEVLLANEFSFEIEAKIRMTHEHEICASAVTAHTHCEFRMQIKLQCYTSKIVLHMMLIAEFVCCLKSIWCDVV